MAADAQHPSHLGEAGAMRVMAARSAVALAARSIICAGFLAAHAAERASAAEEDEPLSAQEVIANPLDDGAYANAARCLGTTRYRRVEIVGDRVLIFHGRRRDAWLNVLPRRCPGLRPDMVLVLEQSGLRLCALDRFTARPRGGAGFPTAVCSLGSFERMTAEQAQVRGVALLAAQRNRIVARTRRAAASEPEAAAAPPAERTRRQAP